MNNESSIEANGIEELKHGTYKAFDLSHSQNIIRVLHVDDESDQLKLTKLFIERADPAILVDSTSSPKRALHMHQPYDCIVSDFLMPVIDGVQLAKIVRETSEIPFIIYTGHGSEEVASKAFAVGVDDYVRKELDPGHFQVLAKRIRHSVEKRRAEQALMESEEKYRSLVEGSINGIAIVQGTDVKYVNRALLKMLGYQSEDEMIGKDFTDFVSPEYRKMMVERGHAREEGDDVTDQYEFKALHKDGHEFDAELSVSRINYLGGIARQGIITDITKQKKAEEELEKSKRHFQALFNIIVDPVVILDDAGTILEVTERMEEVSGYDIEELLGKRFMKLDIVTPESKEILRLHLGKQLKGVDSSPYNIEVVTKYGKMISYEVNAQKIEYRGAPAVMAVLRDITERKLYEERLEALHKHASELASAETIGEIAELTFNAIELVLGFQSGGFNIVRGNMLSPIFIKGINVEPYTDLPLEDSGITARAVRTSQSQIVDDTREDENYLPVMVNGEDISLSELALPVIVDDKVGAVINLESARPNAFDEEDKKLLEILSIHIASAMEKLKHLELLQASEDRYQTLLESSRDAICVIADEKFAYVNRRHAEILGFVDPLDLIGRHAIEFVSPEDKRRVITMIKGRSKGEEHPIRYELRLQRKDGIKIPVETHVSVIDYDGKMASLAFTRDITERKRYEETLVALHRHARELSQSESLDEIFQITLKAMEQTLGFDRVDILMVEEDALKQVAANDELPSGLELPLEGKGIMQEALREKRSILVNDVVKRMDYVFVRDPEAGELIPEHPQSRSELTTPIMVENKAVGVLNVESPHLNAFTRRDETLLEMLAMHVASALSRLRHIERLEEMVEERTKELIDAERMVAAGRIASMVGHDLRSPLQTIKNAVYLLKKSSEHDPDVTDTIEDAVNRTGAMLEELRYRTRETPLKVETINLSEMIQAAVKGASIPDSIDIEIDTGENLEAVSLDRLKMRRVLDNLISNAVGAMPEDGTLTIKARRDVDKVIIGVSDTGVGVSNERMINLFKPFYTTKPTGIGLGLAYCKRAIESHGGTITGESMEGEGTTFTIKLPI